MIELLERKAALLVTDEDFAILNRRGVRQYVMSARADRADADKMFALVDSRRVSPVGEEKSEKDRLDRLRDGPV